MRAARSKRRSASEPAAEAETISAARQRVLDCLKRRGPLATAEVAASLDMTSVAARQHLSALADAGLVACATQPPQGRGRPAAMWDLTERSRQAFPDRHAELTVGLLEAMRQAVGPEGVHRIVEVRARDQAQQYAAALPGESTSLRRRVEALAAMRSAEGYMAEVREVGRGEYHLIEHHCPICDAAKTCLGLCDAELEVFRRCLGRGVRVERIEHMLSQGRRCTYRIMRA